MTHCDGDIVSPKLRLTHILLAGLGLELTQQT